VSSQSRISSSVLARRSLQVAIDAVLIAVAYYLAFVLRFDEGIRPRYERLLEDTIVFVVLGKLVVFALFGLYHKLWRFVDQRDFQMAIRAVLVSTLLLVGALFLLPRGADPPRGVIALDFLLTLLFVGGSRLLVRVMVERGFRRTIAPRGSREVLVVGAGNGGQLVANELRRNPQLRNVVIGFVDDDPRKRAARVAGIKVEGSTDELPRILDYAEPDEVIIAIPSAPGVLRQKVVTACRARGIPVRTMPTVFELLSGGGTGLIRQIREVKVEDILGRDPVRLEIDRVGAYMAGQVVLVTGAGGSIGSELCRQIARVGPRTLVLVDQAENSLFEIQRELVQDRHFAPVASVLADCKDAVRMREIFLDHRPAVVFHAAAYKHVALMEENPIEAVRNNAVATRIVAAAAAEADARRFVLVSTDKAVKPATAMGASKTLAEWAVQGAQHRYSQMRCATVRFGNVLGSSGSVVPIFRRQIAAGGPVTVTDESMTRYFMTIPEAVQLIIRAADLGAGGETYVLEMGDPVRIVDLARNMIRLSGHEPDTEIAVEIVGRRPGEKLSEELFNPDERPQPTPAEKIVMAVGPPVSAEWVEDAFARAEELIYDGGAGGLATAVAALAAERRSLAPEAAATARPS